MINDKSRAFHRLCFLYKREFKIFKFQPVANICTEGEQCKCDLGNDTGFVIFDIAVIAPNINEGTEHKASFGKPAPVSRGG